MGKLSFKIEHASGHPPPREIFNMRVYLLAIVASMAGLCFGYDMGESRREVATCCTFSPPLLLPAGFIGTTIELESLKEDFGLVNKTAAQGTAFSANGEGISSPCGLPC